MDPDVTLVSEVMTPNPTSVRTDDSAMEALGIMVERHFRHLPVSEDVGKRLKRGSDGGLGVRRRQFWKLMPLPTHATTVTTRF